MKLSRCHLLLAVQQEVDLALFHLWLCDSACSLALDREGREILAQVSLCYLLGLTVRDSIHKVADLGQSDFLVTLHHRSTI